MTKVEIKNAQGEKADDLELSEGVFGIEPNVAVMHQATRQVMAAKRQGTHSTKTRGKVRGGGRKPWRQKGTGRARQGSIRSPQWVGGGVVFGPTPRKYSFRMNKKEVRLAMKSALSAKVRDGELVLLEKFDFDEPSTKKGVELIQALGLEGKRITFIVDDEDMNTYLSLRNIPKVEIIVPTEANTYNIINNAALVTTSEIAKHFEEVLQ